MIQANCGLYVISSSSYLSRKCWLQLVSSLLTFSIQLAWLFCFISVYVHPPTSLLLSCYCLLLFNCRLVFSVIMPLFSLVLICLVLCFTISLVSLLCHYIFFCSRNLPLGFFFQNINLILSSPFSEMNNNKFPVNSFTPVSVQLSSAQFSSAQLCTDLL